MLHGVFLCCLPSLEYVGSLDVWSRLLPRKIHKRVLEADLEDCTRGVLLRFCAIFSQFQWYDGVFVNKLVGMIAPKVRWAALEAGSKKVVMSWEVDTWYGFICYNIYIYYIYISRIVDKRRVGRPRLSWTHETMKVAWNLSHGYLFNVQYREMRRTLQEMAQNRIPPFD